MDRRFTPYQRKSAKKAPGRAVLPHSHAPVSWTPDEDEVLRRAVFKHGGKKWKTIATFFQQKTPSQCNQRWNELQNHGSAVKKPWCPNEDMRMIDLVKTHGPGKWAVIASYLPGRNGKQCRERWHNQLNPAIKKGPWTVEEDSIIMEMQSKYGNRWAKITEKLPGRTDNAVKNHWHSSMKAKVKRSSTGSCQAVVNVSAESEIAELAAMKDQSEHSVESPASSAPPQLVQVKLEAGSLSPDSIAVCPSRLTPAFCADNAVFSLDEVFVRDEDIFVPLPQPLGRDVTLSSASDTLGSEDGDYDNDEEDMESVLDGLDGEQLVLSIEPCFGDMMGDTAPASPGSFGVTLRDDLEFEASVPDDSGFGDSEFEPSQIGGSSPSSLQLPEHDVLDAELLEVLSDVSTDYSEPSELDPVKCEPELFHSPEPQPSTGLHRPYWSMSSPTQSPFALSPQPQTEGADMAMLELALGSHVPSLEVVVSPSLLMSMPKEPSPLPSAAPSAWPISQVSTPPPLPPPDQVDDQLFVWDLM